MCFSYLFFWALFIAWLSQVMPFNGPAGSAQFKHTNVVALFFFLWGNTAKIGYSKGEPRSLISKISPGAICPSIGCTSNSQL